MSIATVSAPSDPPVVFIEKPLANSVDAARRLLGVMQSNRVSRAIPAVLAEPLRGHDQDLAVYCPRATFLNTLGFAKSV